MKYSVSVKFVAIILCACSLVSLAFAGIGIAFMEGYDLYQTPISVKQEEQMELVGSTIAYTHAQAYAASTLSNVPEEVLYDIGYQYSYPYNYGGYLVDIYEDGEVVCSEGMTAGETVDREDCFEYRETVRTTYPVVTGQLYFDESGVAVEEETVAAKATGGGVAPASEAPVDEALARVADQEALYSEEYRTGYRYDENLNRAYETVYSINYYEGPEYEVRVYLSQNAMIGADFKLVTALYPYRNYFIPAVLASLVVFAVCFVFLCTVAGRNRKGEVHLAAINRIPLDLYGICLAGLMVLLVLPVIWLFESAYYDNTTSIWGNPQLCLLICCLCGFGVALCAIGFLYAFAAQLKASNNYWLRHTVIGWAFGLLGKGLKWLGQGLSVVGRGFGLTGRGIRAVFLMLPTIWQWLLTAFVMVLIPVFFFFLAVVNYGLFQFFCIIACIAAVIADVAMVCYGGWCFGTLLKGIETMSKGNLNYQIPTKYLYGVFKTFAVQLNSLAGAAQLAAERQMKSERMKTELITNVSHDIKTPLTSIINFVDLMKKPHSEEEGEEYLAVLDRQSQRLKKLIDDLMDMSKASSGTMTVELGQVDATEAINQALGEFADKLDRVRLTPVFRHPEKPVVMLADGKLLWRILSNILNNAVKYALPDTRLYLDLMVLQGNAVIAIKNISREQLNVNAEELMERFVRGDTSRNTEGSGLGLNIAKSLVELQGGQMHLMVDGDLFKVTLILPLA